MKNYNFSLLLVAASSFRQHLNIIQKYNRDMTQLTINIEDSSILPHLKKILNAIEGVSIARPAKKKKCGLDEALDDVKSGRVHHADNVDDMLKQVLGT